jgi:hypothetical protein
VIAAGSPGKHIVSTPKRNSRSIGHCSPDFDSVRTPPRGACPRHARQNGFIVGPQVRRLTCEHPET